MLKNKICITGGAGYLGRAIVRRAIRESWDCSFTILSRDPEKHHKMQVEFPDCRYAIADVCDLNALSKIFSGHDLIIHAAAQKHIPDGERNVRETIRVNVDGSDNVARAAINAKVDRVIGISTDKVCHPVNVYGMTKGLMERLFQEYDRLDLTRFHLVRYGNVLSSTGSVLTVWNQMLTRDGFVTATSPDMTRFWMSIEQAVDAVLLALSEPHGTVTIPKCKALAMDKFAQYTMPEETIFTYNGLRPGEKRYEELLTKEERASTSVFENHFRLWNIGDRTSDVLHRNTTIAYHTDGYRSDYCPTLTKDELLGMLK